MHRIKTENRPLSFDTPTRGVILYYVDEMYNYETAASFSYVPVSSKKAYTEFAFAIGMGFTAPRLSSGGGRIFSNFLYHTALYH